MNGPSTAITRLQAGETLPGAASGPAACEKCRRTFLVAGDPVTLLCPGCVQTTLEPAGAEVRTDPPELLIPWSVDRAELQQALADFIKPVRFAPPDLRADAMAERAVKVWWPMWLVDATVAGHWQADVGFDYEVESAEESFHNGRWFSKTVVQTRVRWEPRVGQVRRRIDNVRVRAVFDQSTIVIMVGQTALDTAIHATPEAMGDAFVRIPDQLPESVWPDAAESFRVVASEICQEAANAQHIRDYYLHAVHEDQHWTWLLLPMWVTWYTDHTGKRWVFLTNGTTGESGGRLVSSTKKGLIWAAILGGISLLLFTLALLVTLVGLVLVPLLVVAVILFAASLGVGLAALWPATWPYRFNRLPTDD